MHLAMNFELEKWNSAKKNDLGYATSLINHLVIKTKKIDEL